MSFFGTAQSDKPSSSMANQTNTVQAQVTLVGEGSVFEGTLKVEDDFRAHGRLIGTLQVDGKAMIAEQGAVEGDIVATDAEIAGQVQGEIHVEERLVLKSTARVDGKIDTDRLVIEEGAQFTGECEMDTPISGSADAASEEGQENGDVSRTWSSATDAESSGEEVPEEATMT
jgi:cytoskeletal protein CcmA (bactofilin family)